MAKFQGILNFVIDRLGKPFFSWTFSKYRELSNFSPSDATVGGESFIAKNRNIRKKKLSLK